MTTINDLNSTTRPFPDPRKIFELPWRYRSASWAKPHELYRADVQQGTYAGLVLRRGQRIRKRGDVSVIVPALEFLDNAKRNGRLVEAYVVHAEADDDIVLRWVEISALMKRVVESKVKPQKSNWEDGPDYYWLTNDLWGDDETFEGPM